MYISWSWFKFQDFLPSLLLYHQLIVCFKVPTVVFARLNLVQEETIAIQMSMRHTPSIILSRAFFGNHMLCLDDTWYVGGARTKNVCVCWILSVAYANWVPNLQNLNIFCLEHISETIALLWWYFVSHVEFWVWHILLVTWVLWVKKS